jgi:hypothetical protein
METTATHSHGATAKMGAPTPAKMSATATEVSTTTAATAKMPATATPAAAASGVSSRRQTQGKAYCGRACRDFPHDRTSSSGPNA